MQFPVTLTRGFLRRSYARRIFRNWWRILIGIVLIVFVVIEDLCSGHFGALSAAGTTVIGFCLLFYGLAWFKQARALDDWLKTQGPEPVIYTLSEETVQNTSVVAGMALRWEVFARLKISDLDVLLVFPRSGALTLPTEQVPAEALDFLKQRFLAHGGKVEDRRRPRPIPALQRL